MSTRPIPTPDEGIRAQATGASDAIVKKSLEILAPLGMSLSDIVTTSKADPVIGRHEELDLLIEVLQRRTKSNAILKGEAGVGKTAIVEALAQRIARGDVPLSLRNATIWQLNMGALISFASIKGKFELTVNMMIDALVASKGRILAFIDEIHALRDCKESISAMDLLKPHLARGTIRVIGCSTHKEVKKFIEPDAAFSRRFQIIEVRQPTDVEAIAILRGLKPKYASHYRVSILDSAVIASVKLARRYLTQKQLPDSSIDLLDSACARVRVLLDSRPEKLMVLEREKQELTIELLSIDGEKASNALMALRTKVLADKLAQVEQQLVPLVARYTAHKKRLDAHADWQQILQHTQEKLSVLEATAASKEALGHDHGPSCSCGKQAEIDAINKELADLKHVKLPLYEHNRSACERAILENASEGLVSSIVSPAEIALVLSRMTGIPTAKLASNDHTKMLQLEASLKRVLIGQDPAIRAVVRAVQRHQAGLSNPRQPIGSFLFPGCTGTGKTHLAEALAVELFGDVCDLVRIDMSEYSEPHSVARLIGSPPGYVGSDDGGYLTEKIKLRPRSIILCDESERSHKTVRDLFLQILDAGRLTDGKGCVVDFSNTLLLFTCNVGGQVLMSRVLALQADDDRRCSFEKIDKADEKTGISNADEKKALGVTATVPWQEHPSWGSITGEVLCDVRKSFSPEFLNRMDDIVIFAPLQPAQLQDIVVLLMQDVCKRLDDVGVDLVVTNKALSWAVTKGFQPELGARPLRRWIEREIVSGLSTLLLQRQADVASTNQTAASSSGSAPPPTRTNAIVDVCHERQQLRFLFRDVVVKALG